MKISVIVAHPDKNSFNHAIVHTVVEEFRSAGNTVFFHDLYKEKFDPILPAAEIPSDALLPPEIQFHCDEISTAEGIVIIHPNWWGQPPAILKGWVDRVIRPGVAYEFIEGDSGEGIPNGLLKAKFALVINTSNTSTEREKIFFGDPLESLWEKCVFELCGVTTFYRKIFSIIVTSSEKDRENWLAESREIVKRILQNT
ncbi:NAD(P)H-dependent oxidoreductase [Thermodesulfobacteriota bacterium]